MTEREKLSVSLQNYYNSQVYTVPSGGWKGTSAVKKNKRRRLALWLLFISGVTVLFTALLSTVSSEGTRKNTRTQATGKTEDYTTVEEPKRTENKSALHAGVCSEPQVVNEPTELPKQNASGVNAFAEAATVTSINLQNIEVQPETELVAAANPVKEETSTPAPNAIVQGFLSPSNNVSAVPLKTVVSNSDSLSISSDNEIQTPHETSVVAKSEVSEAKALNNDMYEGASIDSTQQHSTGAEAQPLSKSDTNVVEALTYPGNALQEESFDSTLKAVMPNALQQHGLSLEAGAEYLLGWRTGSSRDAKGFTGYGGFNFTSIVADKTAFSVGLHYFQVAGLHTSTKTSKVSSYAYGETANITQITPVALHYALVPVRFLYLPNTKHQFGLGINLAYLLNVDANVSSYQQSPMGTSAPVESKESGYLQGFSWYDVQATLFYRRRVGKAFAIHTEVHFGVIDSKDDVFFNLKGKERNSGIKLGLIYYLTTQHKQHGS